MQEKSHSYRIAAKPELPSDHYVANGNVYCLATPARQWLERYDIEQVNTFGLLSMQADFAPKGYRFVTNRNEVREFLDAHPSMRWRPLVYGVYYTMGEFDGVFLERRLCGLRFGNRWEKGFSTILVRYSFLFKVVP